jgi:cyclohexa-1,5-dienecarbonyl-CoA hydratase
MTRSTRSDAPHVTSAVTDGVGVLTLRHPPLNILTRAVLDDLHAALSALAGDPALRVLAVQAEGPHFSAGADVGEHLPPHERVLIPRFMATIRALNEFPLPVLAAVRGRCLGGGFELAQAADMILAGRLARFGQPEIVLGVTAPAACALLPRRCGGGLAAALLFTGDPIDADEALAAGLVRAVVADEDVDAESLRLAERIARHSRAALTLTKRGLRAGAMAREAEAMRRNESIYLEELMRTEDALEGLRAFIEKRKPTWTHR